MKELLFDFPWYYIFLMLIFASLSIFKGIVSNSIKFFLPGCFILLLAIILFLLSTFVKTNVEVAEDFIEDFISFIANNDTESATRFIVADALLEAGADSTDFEKKLRELKRRTKIVSNTNKSIEVHDYENGFIVDVSCLTWPEAYRPVSSEWSFYIKIVNEKKLKISKVVCHKFYGLRPRNTKLWSR
tara:strand:- start:413 stop:973 length:561 start_codon:yes stop_codon:yes gene_type:complete